MSATSTSTQFGSPKMPRNNKPYKITRPQSKNSLLKYTASSGSLHKSRSRSSSVSNANKRSTSMGRTILPPANIIHNRSESPNILLNKSNHSTTSWSISEEYSPISSLRPSTYNNRIKGTEEKNGLERYDEKKMKIFLDEVERRLSGSLNASPVQKKGLCRSVDMNKPRSDSIRSDITIDEDYPLEFGNDNFLKSAKRDDQESEESDCEDDEGNLCIPVPPFVNKMIRKKRKRNKNIIEKAAIQMKSEKDAIDALRSEIDSGDDLKKPTQRQGIQRLMDIGVGDIGLTLFIPINWEAFEALDNADITEGTIENDNDLDNDSASIDSEDDIDSDDDIMVALEDDIESYPPILTRRQMREMAKVLPPSVSLMTWNRAYSLSRDGDFFQTMVRKCAGFQHTIIVIKTDQGDILGGYADTPWGAGGNKAANSAKSSRTFFGGGRAFLYATNPCLTEHELAEELRYRNPKDSIFFYRWTGENTYSQICDLDKGTMGMGGGGAFGFYIQEDFSVGSSGYCFTFRNPPLTKTDDGQFKILDFEVYGFSSMAKSYSSMSMRSRTSSISSFNTSSVSSMLG